METSSAGSAIPSWDPSVLGIDELAAVRFPILEKLAIPVKSRKDVLMIGSERLGWRCRVRIGQKAVQLGVDVRRIEIPVCIRWVEMLRSDDIRGISRETSRRSQRDAESKIRK